MISFIEHVLETCQRKYYVDSGRLQVNLDLVVKVQIYEEEKPDQDFNILLISENEFIKIACLDVQAFANTKIGSIYFSKINVLILELTNPHIQKVQFNFIIKKVQVLESVQVNQLP